MINMINKEAKETIISRNNLTVCGYDYYETCWCKINSTIPITCPYLLYYAGSFSNSTYFCVYHMIRKSIECFNSSYIFPKSYFTNVYVYLTLALFIIGLFGNGISMIILISTNLRRLNIYRNLTILCFLNILYLALILIRHKNKYQQDIRDISTDFCRLHTFAVAFIGHLCSWQLVSTSVQRVHGLLSLQSHRTTSWRQTWCIFMCIVFSLFIFDGQILFNYGFFQINHVCNELTNYDIKQFRRALRYPINILKFPKDIPLIYHPNWSPNSTIKINKGHICLIWNTLDTFIYAIIPFVITLICSIIIILKVCQRRRSTVVLGGVCHINRDFVSSQGHLSTLLITINLLFFVMTAPLNISLIIQSILDCYLVTTSSMRIFAIINEYLRLLQNTYHALSFIFYCIIGNKFRNSAKSICRTIYSKLLEFGCADRCAKTPLIGCCLVRRRSSSSGHTTSTNSRISENRRLTIEQNPNHLLPLNVIRRSIYVTYDIHQKTIVRSTTPL